LGNKTIETARAEVRVVKKLLKGEGEDFFGGRTEFQKGVTKEKD